MKTNEYSIFENLIKTKADAQTLESEINVILTSLKDDQMLKNTLERSVRFSTAEIIKNKLSELNDKNKMEEFLYKFKENLQKLKTLKLILAFEPTEEIIKNIHAWITENLGTGIIIEIELDSAIIGGAIIIYRGLYKDFSLRRLIDEKFKNQNPQSNNQST